MPDETAVVYVSPLKALSNDIRLNLEAPIQGIREELRRLALPDVEIIWRFAQKMGFGTQFTYENAEAVYAHIDNATSA